MKPVSLINIQKENNQSETGLVNIQKDTHQSEVGLVNIQEETHQSETLKHFRLGHFQDSGQNMSEYQHKDVRLHEAKDSSKVKSFYDQHVLIRGRDFWTHVNPRLDP